MDEERARRLLEAERDRLESLLAAMERTIQGDLEAPREELSRADQHPADEATELFEQERDLGLEQDLRRQLGEVDAAFERLGEGTYGICEACGRPIGDERLEAVPTARLCVDDQERAERGLAPR